MKKTTRFIYGWLFVCLFVCSQTIGAQTQVGLWSKFQTDVQNTQTYTNPFTQTVLIVECTRPDQTKLIVKGFYDGGTLWKIRVMPDKLGTWTYTAWFTDATQTTFSGAFECISSDIPGLVSADETNPVWFGYKGGGHVVIRSFHVGDRFFASNYADSDRNKFLDSIVANKYNTLSIASHLLNRNEAGRGVGWSTPNLWNSSTDKPNPAEYTKMERILDILAARKIIVFPFAGFFGQNANYPRDAANQATFINYTVSRLGAYWNELYNVAGPEPLYVNVKEFTASEIDTLGKKISIQNTQGHLLSIHNETDKNPFKNSPWFSYQVLQGPKTINLRTLYDGLMARKNVNQPLYAQEVLWYGNIYQLKYSDVQLRQNAWVIMMAGGALNFADNNGDSSSGYSGTLDINQRHQPQHNILKGVWDFMETIPFYEMTPVTNGSTSGYCLAKTGSRYLVYLPVGGNVSVTTPAGTTYNGVWINAANTNTRVNISGTTTGSNLTAPSTSSDWLLYLTNAVVDVNPLCGSAVPWTNSAIIPQTGIFIADFDAIPGGALMDGAFGLSKTSATTYNDFACTVRFYTNGKVEARNAGAYESLNELLYVPNTSYHIRMVVNVLTHKYDIYATPAGGAEVAIGTAYSFRAEQAAVAQLANFAYTTMSCGLTVSGFSITTSTAFAVNNIYETISVYPNPINKNGYLTIDFGAKLEKAIVEISDISAKVIFRNFINAESQVKIKSNIQSGIFLLKVKQGNNSYSQKIVVK